MDHFLQNTGMGLQLDLKRSRHGLYAEALNHVLKRLGGYYFEGREEIGPNSCTRVMP